MKQPNSSPKPPVGLIKDDPWLEPYAQDIEDRLQRYEDALQQIRGVAGSLEAYVDAYQYFGINYDAKARGWWYREWAPNASRLSLMGDFNNWDREAHVMEKSADGIWEIFLPEATYASSFTHESKVKVHVQGKNGNHDRIPAWIKRAVQDPVSHDFTGQIWEPKEAFTWTDTAYSPANMNAPLIYEAHTGMAQEKEEVGTYREFADEVLPRIHKQGYNCLQLMAVQEHPYYGSFGYHVSSFFAPSSRFGTPEDLKYLINKAHGFGIAVIMDIVHSHAVKNFAEGLNLLDGSDDHYFHPGGRGEHSGWDSKLFNYGKPEVQQFLLSNVAYWIKEFHFDGYRFDGVTSMLYFHHGEHVSFDHYDKYFKEGVEWDAITYLQLANTVAHQAKPGVLTIAEDMSGMPGMCRTIEEGGIGFDYRLGMGIPDYWIKILKHKRDEEWDIHEMWGVMTNRRFNEKTIAYAESHDQALVGDKTIAFWLMDQEMYWNMSTAQEHPVIDRGIALHKLIRLFTIALGGEGYLNFIGNEFGHPEWVDFPREGNGWSHKYARRQWSLVDNELLRYQHLNAFDQAMVTTIKNTGVLNALPAKQLNMDTGNQVVVCERNNLIFIFNFHPQQSIENYRFTVPQEGKYEIILNSDNPAFGGHGRIDETMTYETFGKGQLSLYLTNRTALVLKRLS